MRTRTEVVQQRIDALRAKLESVQTGDVVTFDALRASLPEGLRKGLNENSLSHALKQLRKDIERNDPRSSLEIQRTAVRVIVNDETLFDENMERNVAQKKTIAAVLWNWLFDFPLTGKSTLSECWRGTDTRPANEHIRERMERKRAILRGRVNPALVIDAGSTNTIAITHFLATAKSVPILIWEHKKDFNAVEKREAVADKKPCATHDLDNNEDVRYHRLLSPVIMTNSIVIADKIATSRFRQSIVLRVIGGTDRPERRSICGELSLLWLRSCDQDGKLISLDLAIIGSTGLEKKRFEKPVLECDAAEEASLKSRLLAMSKFRIVLMDSDKLIKGGGTSMFAAVSEGDVDLIITDSGKDKPAERAVREFAALCDESGVGLLVANLE